MPDSSPLSGSTPPPWNVVLHVCPRCGRVFSSPSVCVSDDSVATQPKRYMSREQATAKLADLPMEYPNPAREDEPWVRLTDVMEALAP